MFESVSGPCVLCNYKALSGHALFALRPIAHCRPRRSPDTCTVSYSTRQPGHATNSPDTCVL